MRLFDDLWGDALRIRRENLEAARDAGRLGTPRVPDSVLFPATGDPAHDLSDTAIHRLVDEHQAGRAEREAQS